MLVKTYHAVSWQQKGPQDAHNGMFPSLSPSHTFYSHVLSHLLYKMCHDSNTVLEHITDSSQEEMSTYPTEHTKVFFLSSRWLVNEEKTLQQKPLTPAIVPQPFHGKTTFGIRGPERRWMKSD